MRILTLGEIVGKTGISAIKSALPGLKKEFSIDATIACANAVTGGFGLGKNHALYLRKLGVNVLTGGDYVLFKKDLTPELDTMPFVLRPLNMPPKAPGFGSFIYKTASGERVGVINFMGQSRVFTPTNPFPFVFEAVERMKKETPFVVVTIFSLATAEKQTMGYYLAGKVSAVIGMGGRALTADANIIAQKTAFITDVGRTGSGLGAGGLVSAREYERLVSQRPGRGAEETRGAMINGVVVELNADGATLSVTPINRPVESDAENYENS